MFNCNKIESTCGRFIYHIAIIDYLQEYNLQKRGERLFKQLMHYSHGNFSVGHQLSVIDPKRYRQRFI